MSSQSRTASSKRAGERAEGNVIEAVPELTYLPDTEVEHADEDPDNPTSFKYSCKKCRKVTWWNPISTLTGLMRINEHPALSEEGDQE